MHKSRHDGTRAVQTSFFASRKGKLGSKVMLSRTHVCRQIIGGPLASALLSLDGCLGLAGWQWLFIMEGIPTVLLGIWMRSALVESPAKARFLQPQEREWVQQRVAKAWVGAGGACQRC